MATTMPTAHVLQDIFRAINVDQGAGNKNKKTNPFQSMFASRRPCSHRSVELPISTHAASTERDILLRLDSLPVDYIHNCWLSYDRNTPTLLARYSETDAPVNPALPDLPPIAEPGSEFDLDNPTTDQILADLEKKGIDPDPDSFFEAALPKLPPRNTRNSTLLDATIFEVTELIIDGQVVSSMDDYSWLSWLLLSHDSSDDDFHRVVDMLFGDYCDFNIQYIDGGLPVMIYSSYVKYACKQDDKVRAARNLLTEPQPLWSSCIAPLFHTFCRDQKHALPLWLFRAYGIHVHLRIRLKSQWREQAGTIRNLRCFGETFSLPEEDKRDLELRLKTVVNDQDKMNDPFKMYIEYDQFIPARVSKNITPIPDTTRWNIVITFEVSIPAGRACSIISITMLPSVWDCLVSYNGRRVEALQFNNATGDTLFYYIGNQSKFGILSKYEYLAALCDDDLVLRGGTVQFTMEFQSGISGENIDPDNLLLRACAMCPSVLELELKSKFKYNLRLL